MASKAPELASSYSESELMIMTSSESDEVSDDSDVWNKSESSKSNESRALKNKIYKTYKSIGTKEKKIIIVLGTSIPIAVYYQLKSLVCVVDERMFQTHDCGEEFA